MKIKAFYLSALAAIVTGLVSCENAELKYDDVTGPGRLFLNEAVGMAKSTSFVIPDDGTVYTVTPRISKPLDKDLKLTVYVDEKRPRRVQQAEQYVLHTASRHQLRIRKQRRDPRRKGRLQSGDNHPASAHHGAEQDGIHPCAAHRRKAPKGMPYRYSTTPMHSSWPPHRFPIRNVVEVTGNSYLQTRFAEDYKLVVDLRNTVQPQSDL